MAVSLGDTTTVPKNFSDLQGTITPAQAPTSLQISPELSNNSTAIATTAWVKGQSYATVTNGTGPVFADAEAPSGIMDGVNNTFTLINTPNPTGSLQVFYNGILLDGTQYLLNTNTIILAFAPQSGDSLVTYYRH